MARPRSGAHLLLHVGDAERITVVTPTDVYSGWTNPRSTSPRVAQIGHITNPLRNGVSYNCSVTAVIEARHAGHAYVIASTDLPCFHAHPVACLAPASEWRVQVTVSKRS